MYLVDTNVLSTAAPSGSDAYGRIAAWLDRNGEYLYFSVVSVAEISFGIAWLEHRGATRKSAGLAAWLSDMMIFHASRVLPVDHEIALRAGQLQARARAAGTDTGLEDALIAATADLRGLVVLTRNARHFSAFSVAHIDPFQQLPPDAAR